MSVNFHTFTNYKSVGMNNQHAFMGTIFSLLHDIWNEPANFSFLSFLYA